MARRGKLLHERLFPCFRHGNCEEDEMDVVRKPSSSGGGKQGKERSRNCRSLRRVLKIVFFESSLAKKVCRRKSEHNLYASKHKKISNKIKQAPVLSVTNLPSNHLKTISTRTSTAFSTPSCSSSGSSMISTISTRQDERSAAEYKRAKTISPTNIIAKKHGLNYGLCLLVVCLWILTCWGKACAIFCTSSLFVLVSGRVKRVDLARKGRVHSLQMDLKEHNKRVVMEGLLSREYSRVYSH